MLRKYQLVIYHANLEYGGDFGLVNTLVAKITHVFGVRGRGYI